MRILPLPDSQRVALGKKWKHAWLGILLLAATVAAYLPAILHGGYVWDDDAHLTRNPVIFAPNGLSAIWSKVTWRVEFYPLTFTSFWLQYRLCGLNPLSYHLVNVLIHGVNALLVWGIARRLKLAGAFWVALLFSLHPLNVESVAWVTERKNVLMGLFYFLATLTYLQFESGGSRRNWWWYAAAFAAFVAALLSKTVCCTFPAGMAVILWWRDGTLSRRTIALLIPPLVVGLAFAVGTAYLEKAVVGSVGAAWQYSPVERVLIAGRAVCFYVTKFLWPAELCFSYPLWHTDAASPWQYLFPMVVLAVLGVLWRWQKHIGRGPLAASLFFLVTISPALGFVSYYTMIYSLVADHYVYLAILGLICIVVEAVYRFLRISAVPDKLPAVLLGSWALALGILTFQRTRVYRDAQTLWQDTLAKNPSSWLAHTSLGVELRRKGDADGALQEFQAALAINPHCYEALNDIGNMLADAGRLNEASRYFEQVIQYQPKASAGYGNLASVRFRQGDLVQAGALYQQAVELDPYDHDARINYGKLLATLGKFDAAAKMFQEASALVPQDAAAELYWGRCLAAMGKLAEARRHFEKAVELRPEWKEAENDLKRTREEPPP
jgi:protein O-mannosyl-transferase